MRVSPQQAADILKRRAKALKTEVAAAEKNTARLGKIAAIRLSSGPYSQAVLTAMGHPYARRAPGRLNPGIINLQTGNLARRWNVRQKWPANAIVTTIFNTSPEAAFMAGTRYMVERPLPALVLLRLHPIRKRALQRAARKAMSVT